MEISIQYYAEMILIFFKKKIVFKMRLKCVTDKSDFHLLTLNCWKKHFY